MFEDFISPVTAAQTLLHSAVSKRKGVLNETVEFCMTIINGLNANPKQKDGALHIVGAIADILLKVSTDPLHFLLVTVSPLCQGQVWAHTPGQCVAASIL